jgi:hypothetical protein
VTGPIQYTGTYPHGHSGSASTPGLIDEAGAFASTAELGSGAFEVFSVPMRTIAAGTLVFTSNPADQLPVHQVLAYGFNEPVPAESIHYGTAAVTIGDFSSLDVNLDGSIAPSDALMIINAISDQLALGIGDGSLPQTSEAGRLDISKDGYLTAIDALVIINRLNEPASPLLIVDHGPTWRLLTLDNTHQPYAVGELPSLQVEVKSDKVQADKCNAALKDEALLALQTDDKWLDLAAPRHLRSHR